MTSKTTHVSNNAAVSGLTDTLRFIFHRTLWQRRIFSPNISFEMKGVEANKTQSKNKSRKWKL